MGSSMGSPDGGATPAEPPPPHPEPLDPEAWATPEALHEAWLGLFERHRKREFDQAEFDAFAINPLARCAALSQALRAGLWRQQSLRTFEIPKASSGHRVLRVPILADRVVQAALARWLAERCEPWLHEASHAYRSARGTATALRAAAAALRGGQHHVLKADIQDFFDSVDLRLLVEQLRKRGLWAHRLAHTMRQVLRAEVEAPSGRYCISRGLAQGSPLSPVLANVALHDFDTSVATAGATLVRYADDFLLLADTRVHLELAADRARRALQMLGLQLNEGKTHWLEPGAAIPFLGQQISSATAASTAGAAEAPDASTADAAAVPEAATAAPPTQAATPLLRTLYLVSDNSRLSRDGDTLVVDTPEAPTHRIPGARLNQVLAFGSTHLTSGAIALCLEWGIPVMLTTARGRHFGVVDPLGAPNVPLLTAQIDASRNEVQALPIARALVAAKLRNSALVLRRWQRHHPTEAGVSAVQRVTEAARRATSAPTLESLRGVEGSAAAAHFAAMGQSLSPEWGFNQRRRQPPPDPVNSMLSYGYTVLYYNMLTLLLARGLHPHIGFLHSTRAGHHALVSDLMEPFRPLVVDTVVSDLVRNAGVKRSDFQLPAAPGMPCLMSPPARTAFIHALEARLNTRLTLRGTELQLDLRRLMDMQALSLQDHLLGRSGAFVAHVGR